MPEEAKYIPGFLINGLKRLIHQDFINEYLRQGYVGVDFCEHTLAYLDVKVKVDGLENISDLSRKYTFVSNHPLGAIDGVTLGMVLGRHYGGKIKYLVNDLLMNLKGLAPLCIPINKLGKQRVISLNGREYFFVPTTRSSCFRPAFVRGV